VWPGSAGAIAGAATYGKAGTAAIRRSPASAERASGPGHTGCCILQLTVGIELGRFSAYTVYAFLITYAVAFGLALVAALQVDRANPG
jgi:hypothetical protein